MALALAEEEDGVTEKPEDGDVSLGAEAEENRVEETDCREDVGAAEEVTAEEAEAEGLPVGVAELAVAVAEEAESDGVPGAMTNDEDTADDAEGDAVLDTADEDPRDALGVELDVTDADEETEGGTDALDATVETGEGDAEPKTEEASALETADGGAIEMTLVTSNELVTIAELDGTELDTEFKTDETDAVDSADADAVDCPLGGTSTSVNQDQQARTLASQMWKAHHLVRAWLKAVHQWKAPRTSTTSRTLVSRYLSPARAGSGELPSGCLRRPRTDLVMPMRRKRTRRVSGVLG